MCLLALMESEKMTKEEFETAFKSNKDGVGFAYRKKEGNFFIKGYMELNGAWEFYDKNVNSFPHIVHFRAGTAGGVSSHLTHPFIIGKTTHEEADIYCGKKDLLFHNGCLTDWKGLFFTLAINGIKLQEPYSDTMVLAVMLGKMKSAGYSYDEGMKNFNGKYIIMTLDEFIVIGDFIKDGGRLFSNSGYKPYSYKKDDYQDFKRTEYGYWWKGKFNPYEYKAKKQKQLDYLSSNKKADVKKLDEPTLEELQSLHDDFYNDYYDN